MLHEQYTGFLQSNFSIIRQSTDRFVEKSIFRLDDSLNFVYVACKGRNFEEAKLEEEGTTQFNFDGTFPHFQGSADYVLFSNRL